MVRRIPYREIAGTIILLASTLTVANLTAHRKIETLAEPLESIQREIDGFSSIDNPALPEGTLRELRATSYLSRTYKKAGIPADLFIAYYAQQRAGESMHSPKHCLPGSGWEIWNYGFAGISANGKRIQVNQYSIRHETSRAVVLYWYQSKGRIIAGEYLGKMLLAKDALVQNSTAAAIVRIIVPDTPGGVEAASEFAAGVIPEVQRCFGK